MTDQIKLALSLFQQAKPDDALNTLQPLLAAKSKNAFAWFLAAIIHSQKHNPKDAIDYFKKAIKLQPVYPEALNNLGVVYEAINKPEQAKPCYEKAIKQKKDYANAYYNLANIYKAEKEFSKAIEHYNLALKHNPQYSNALNNLGLVYQSLGSYSNSQQYFDKALMLSPNDPEILNNLGFNNYCLHQYSQALSTFQQILSSIPNYSPTILNMGMLLQAMGNFDEARMYFTKLLDSEDYCIQAKNNLAFLDLSTENYVSGWQHYRARPSMRNMNFSSPESLPANLSNKRILLYKDQGLGDELFFSRYIPQLNVSENEISYFTDKKLSSLWQLGQSKLDIITKQPEISEFDLVISMGDLPELLQNYDQSEIPSPLPLKPNSQILEKARNLLPHNGKPNIGITWEAGVRRHNNLYKQIPPGLLGKHLANVDANILILQRNPSSKDIKSLEKNLGRKSFNYAYVNDDLEEMHALLSLLDDYVCVSNTNLHLMASLGKPAHVLVPHPPEWRWGYKDISPWFPLAHIYRQDLSGNWMDSLKTLNKVLINRITN